jgi:RimK family alpha-L-glutamate ligase
MKRILILTSGKKSKLTPFKLSKRKLKIDLTIASFDDVYFDSGSRELLLKGEIKISEFKVIYFRLVGKSLETAALVVEYAKKRRVRIVDRIYQKSQVFPVTQSKAQEMKLLSDANVSIPVTFFGSLVEIVKKSKEVFSFPFVIKSTSGKRGREVYAPKDRKALKALIVRLLEEEKSGKKFLAQEYVNCIRRIRVLVVGGCIIGSICQLTKWRKRVSGYTPKEDEKKIDKFTLNKELGDLALKAVAVVGIDIAGVDILVDEKTGKNFVIEVNAAPSWKLIKKYCKVNVEYEILKFVSR